VWNKFEGRSDELKRLITEATKAIDQRNPELSEAIEEEQAPKPKPQRLAAFLKDVKPPKWLIDGIATEGSVGFIAGSPKSFKSWTALDMALSVATGGLFLDYFRVVKPGRVLYIQEEDSAITVKSRTKKIWRGKSTDKVVLEKGEVYWIPGSDEEFDPNIDIYLMEGFTASEGHWHEWLDQTMTEAANEGDPYVLLIVDTLMNTAGNVEENKSQEMTTKIFKPMKVLMRKHNCAMRFVHHMGKGGDDKRGGQRMLGGTANHAWAEDSLYISRIDNGNKGFTGKIKMEFESKSAPESMYTISGLDNKGWTPYFEPVAKKEEPVPTTPGRRSRGASTPKDAKHPIVELLEQGGSWSTKDVAEHINRPYNSAYTTLKRLAEAGKIDRVGKAWRSPSKQSE
jgi:RecA-family ATPase